MGWGERETAPAQLNLTRIKEREIVGFFLNYLLLAKILYLLIKNGYAWLKTKNWILFYLTDPIANHTYSLQILFP